MSFQEWYQMWIATHEDIDPETIAHAAYNAGWKEAIDTLDERITTLETKWPDPRTDQ